MSSYLSDKQTLLLGESGRTENSSQLQYVEKGSQRDLKVFYVLATAFFLSFIFFIREFSYKMNNTT